MGKKQSAYVPKPGRAKAKKQNNTKERLPTPGLVKDAAGTFLKDRQNKKIKNLRAPGLAELAAPQPNTVLDASASSGLGGIQDEAEKRIDDFDTAAASAIDNKKELTTTDLNPDREAEHTRKKFWGELRKVLASAEIVIEVLDARDPMSCRSLDMEKQVTKQGKRLVLLLNKIDLVPKHAIEAWQKHLKRSFPCLVFKAAHGGAKRPVHAMTSAANAPDGLLQSTHAVVGADELMQLLKNYARIGDGQMKAHTTVGVVGYPNTGKSSVINSMKRHCAVCVGGKAGVTKEMQEVKLDSKVTLLDCPGIVFEGHADDPAIVLRNVVKVENINDPINVADALLRKAPRDALMNFYGLTEEPADVRMFLIHIAQTRGKLRRGAGLDMEGAARAVIADWTTGRFRYFTMPPAESAAHDAEAVKETTEVLNSSLGSSIDIDALLSGAGADPVVLGAPDASGMDMEMVCEADMGGGDDDI